MPTSILNNLLGLSRGNKRFIQICVDILLISTSYLLAMGLRLDGFAYMSDSESWVALAIVLPASILVFIRLGFYRTIIRYVSSKAVETIIIGIAFSALTLLVVSQFLGLPVPRSVPVIYSLIAFFLIGGVRFLLRGLLNRQNLRSKEPIVIYGAGESGRQLLNALVQSPEYITIAYVDDKKDLHRQEIGGVQVFAPDQLNSLIKKHDVKTILLAVPSASRRAKRRIIDRLESLSVEVRTIPGIADLVSGKASVSDLKIVAVEDLLGRDTIPSRKDLLNKNIKHKTVLVSGAGGSIGSELCRQIIEQHPKVLVLFDVSEYALYTIGAELNQLAQSHSIGTKILPIIGSVQNPQRIETVLNRFRVDTIYHAAAYKHVPLVEQNIVEGLRNNIFGTKTIAQAAISAGVKDFILISTDKAVRPTNFMGASKRMAEFVCQAFAKEQSATVFSMVRFGNVLGSSGSVIPKFREQIERDGPVMVTHPEITRFFMTIPEAAQLVIQAGAMAQGGDVFVLDMGEPIRIVDLAQRMIKLHGLSPFFPDNENFGPQSGDIAIKFSGLRKGEKLYEELLVGNNPVGTQHPRIMTANEISLDKSELKDLLEALLESCVQYDVDAIKKLLMDAPLEFNHVDEPSDLIWEANVMEEYNGQVSRRCFVKNA